MDSNPYQSTTDDGPTSQSVRRFSFADGAWSLVTGAGLFSLALLLSNQLPSSQADWIRVLVVGSLIGVCVGVALKWTLRTRTEARCSFCQKGYQVAGPLIEGPDHVFICGACLEVSQHILEHERQRRLVNTKAWNSGVAKTK